MNPLVSAARKMLTSGNNGGAARFRHRGRRIDSVDCVGMVRVAYSLCGVDLPDYTLYEPEPSDGQLVKHIIAAIGDPIALSPVRQSQLQPGDVIALKDKGEPFHVALVTDYPLDASALGMIHACGHNRKVIEHRLSPDFIRRITHVFRRPV